MQANQVRLLWFYNPSLAADYGSFRCQACGRVFYYSPRLQGMYCHPCAMHWLAIQSHSAASAVERSAYAQLLSQLVQLTA